MGYMRISAAAPRDPSLPLLEDDRRPDARWFSGGGCVVPDAGGWLVFVRGTLVGRFGDARDRASRNVVLMALAEDAKMHLGQLAEAFDISCEALRQMRRVYETQGIAPLLSRAPGGGAPRMAPALRRRVEKLFDEGATVDEAHTKVKHRTSRGSVGRIRRAWKLAKDSSKTTSTQPAAVTGSQLALVPPASEEAGTGGETPAAAGDEALPVLAEPSAAALALVEAAAPAELQCADFESDELKSAKSVQHLGTWLLIAVTHQLGLHHHATSAAGTRVEKGALRLAIDAVVVALAVGQKCVEGVRRLATATCTALLLASGAPSPTWTRRMLGRFAADGGGAALHLLMAREYLAAAGDNSVPAGPVFYIDNHMRPYTGLHDLRRGWRMQDKRARPGVSDYYVHDEDGRPVARLAIASHDSLTKWLSPIARLLRLGLGEEVKAQGKRVLLAFDRAGAFPEQMAELRDENFEFVTYERGPCRALPLADFTEKLIIDKERLLFCESRANLGAGRGRVRRIAVRMPDGHQVNILAVSTRTAAEIIPVMRGRWNQENGFKYGVERWGINQLDGRKVVAYAPDTIIPNPARRRLDRALRIARASEGQARNELAHLKKNDPRREKTRASLEHALAQQKKLLKLRPSTPTHAPLEETELAQTLVHHTVEYKMTLDSIRIACANAESDLAAELSRHLPRAAEAKKTLANLFAAPGDIQVGKHTIGVCLSPAGNRPEQRAFSALLEVVNGWKLTLPGDQQSRPLRFRTSHKSQVS